MQGRKGCRSCLSCSKPATCASARRENAYSMFGITGGDLKEVIAKLEASFTFQYTDDDTYHGSSLYNAEFSTTANEEASLREGTDIANWPGVKFQLKECPAANECQEIRRSIPCQDTNRLTAAVLPRKWTELPVSFPSNQCETVAQRRCVDPIKNYNHARDSKLLCSVPGTAACMRGIGSFSWLPCSLIQDQTCVSVADIAAAFDAAKQARDVSKPPTLWDIVYDDTVNTGASDYVLVIHTPDNMNLKVTLFQDRSCLSPIPGKEQTSSPSWRELKWASSRTEFFKVQVASSSARVCSCGQNIAGINVKQEDTSVVCASGQCPLGQVLTKVKNKCNFDFQACEYCDRHHTRMTAEDTKCVRCPNERPHRDKTAEACRACEDHEYFEFYSSPNLDQQGCTPLKNMTVLTNGVIPPGPNFDEYRKAPFEKATPENGWYRDTMSSTAECVATAQQMCSISVGQYLHGCVRRIPANNQFYVRTTTTPTSPAGPPTLFTDFQAPQAIHQVTVVRTGACRDCTKCEEDEYLLGCLDTDDQYAITIGVRGGTHEENKGTCMACSSAATLMDNQFLWHPQPGNCTRWPTEFSTADYQIRTCALVLSSPVQWFLVAGCNKMVFRWWSSGRTTTVLGDRSKPAEQECAPGDSGAACALPDLDRAPGLQPGPPATAALWWSAYHQPAEVVLNLRPGFEAGGGTARVPYCPPGWHVDSACAARITVWDAECCRECLQCRSEEGLRRSKDWVACTGATAADTQSYCQRSCDKGYYESKEKDQTGNYSVCKQCELC